MTQFRMIFISLAGAALCGAVLFLTASLVTVVALAAGLSLAIRAFSLAKPQPAPVRARAHRTIERVWNDGRGTIIDM